MPNVIGQTSTCQGTENPYLRGHIVRIAAVLKGAAQSEFADRVITDDDDLALHGGLTVDDRVEVQPWLETESRWSFVTSDPRATDLGLFATLGGGR